MLSYVMTRKSDLFLCRNFWWHKVDQGGKERSFCSYHFEYHYLCSNNFVDRTFWCCCQEDAKYRVVGIELLHIYNSAFLWIYGIYSKMSTAAWEVKITVHNFNSDFWLTFFGFSVFRKGKKIYLDTFNIRNVLSVVKLLDFRLVPRKPLWIFWWSNVLKKWGNYSLRKDRYEAWRFSKNKIL